MTPTYFLSVSANLSLGTRPGILPPYPQTYQLQVFRSLPVKWRKSKWTWHCVLPEICIQIREFFRAVPSWWCANIIVSKMFIALQYVLYLRMTRNPGHWYYLWWGKWYILRSWNHKRSSKVNSHFLHSSVCILFLKVRFLFKFSSVNKILNLKLTFSDQNCWA